MNTINLANGIAPLLIGLGILFAGAGTMFYYAYKWDKRHPNK